MFLDEFSLSRIKPLCVQSKLANAARRVVLKRCLPPKSSGVWLLVMVVIDEFYTVDFSILLILFCDTITRLVQITGDVKRGAILWLVASSIIILCIYILFIYLLLLVSYHSYTFTRCQQPWKLHLLQYAQTVRNSLETCRNGLWTKEMRSVKIY